MCKKILKVAGGFICLSALCVNFSINNMNREVSDVSLVDLAKTSDANAECVSTSFNNGSCGISKNCFWGRGDDYDCDTTRG